MEPSVLVVGGVDSSGGAGLARDLRVLADLSVAATVVVTAVTAQTDAKVYAIHDVPQSVIVSQLEAAQASRPIRAIKIGMLGSRQIIESVATQLPSRAAVPIVLDPVHVSSSGHALLDEEGLIALREQLLPLVTLVTPNIPEAAAILGVRTASTESELIAQAEQILRLGPDSVLLKGGHARSKEAVDILVRTSHPPIRLVAPRIATTMRGTGCALASAVAAHLAKGATLEEACEQAKQYLYRQLACAAIRP